MSFAAEIVKWSALGKEALIALIGGVAVVAAYGFVVIGVTRFQQARETRRISAAAIHLSTATVGALICLAALIAGIVAMTHKS